MNRDQRTSDVFERALFDSAHADAVPEGSRHRVAFALGLGGPANGAGGDGALASELGASPRGTSKVAARGAARGALSVASQSLLVIVGGGLAALVVFGGSGEKIAPSIATTAPAQLASPPSTEPLSPRVHAAAAAETAGVPHPSAAHATTPSATSTQPPARGASQGITTRRASKPLAVRAAAPARGAESRLLEEVTALDLARAALANADAPLALERLRRYSAEFPEGVLAEEARRLEARARSRAEGSNPAATRH